MSMMPSDARNTARLTAVRLASHATGTVLLDMVREELAAGRAVICEACPRAWGMSRGAIAAAWCEQSEDDRRIEEMLTVRYVR